MMKKKKCGVLKGTFETFTRLGLPNNGHFRNLGRHNLEFLINILELMIRSKKKF